MKVLITGGYGFIGSHVAERFNKEGHQVFILDNLSTGYEKNINFRHKSYRLNIQDKKCDEIFRNNKFDIVIHLAAQASVTSSVENPYNDASTNLLGLINMLYLSNKYSVKKFIFTSSAAVYGSNVNLPLKEEYQCEPKSPYGVSKFAGELYCKKWYQIYGLNTLCFRLSNVYGPRQGTKSEGGVVSIYMEGLTKDKPINVFGDGNQTRDFIYVEDVADAMYKSIFTDTSGVLNLSTNTENSINSLIKVLKSKHTIKDIMYKDVRKDDIPRSRLDNERVIKELDWVPIYSLDKGIEKTIRWYVNHFDDFKSEAAATLSVDNKISVFSKLLPYLENTLAFLLVLFLTNITRYNADFSVFDFKLLYIILMGIMYGTRQSTISVALSTILYINTSLSMGRDIISLIYDPDSLLQISIYILVGLSIGYTIDRKNRDIQFREAHSKLVEEKYTFINDIYNETRLVKEELQNQIIDSQDSFGKIYSITKELDSLQPEGIFNASVNVLEKVMKSNSISIYIVGKNEQFLRLVSSSKNLGFDIPKSIKITGSPVINNVLSTREMFINSTLDPGLPMIMSPIIDNDKVIALVSIHNIKFENLTLYYQNLFQIVIGLITSSLSRAHKYEEATLNERYINGTRILKWENFMKILESKRQAKIKLNYDYTILLLKIADFNIEELSHALSNSIREVDYISISENGYVYILLSNTNKSDAGIVIIRLNSIGITANIVNEEYENE